MVFKTHEARRGWEKSQVERMVVEKSHVISTPDESEHKWNEKDINELIINIHTLLKTVVYGRFLHMQKR